MLALSYTKFEKLNVEIREWKCEESCVFWAFEAFGKIGRWWPIAKFLQKYYSDHPCGVKPRGNLKTTSQPKPLMNKLCFLDFRTFFGSYKPKRANKHLRPAPLPPIAACRVIIILHLVGALADQEY